MMTSLWIFLTGLIRRWTFLTSVVAAARMVSTMPLGCSLTGTGSKGFSSSHLGRGVAGCGSRKSPLPAPALPAGLRGQALGRQAGGDVLGALDFVRVAVLIDLLRRGRAADGLGAGLGGVAVGLLLAMAQAAAGAEAHAAPAPGKISVTHN